jgi:hypothetical protein
MTKNGKSTSELIAEYRQAAIGVASNDPATNNKNADKIHACYKILRQTEEGRARIVQLISDDNRHVRLWAASHSLQWVPDVARAALEALRDSSGPASFEAKWTLIELDEGSLSFDY